MGEGKMELKLGEKTRAWKTWNNLLAVKTEDPQVYRRLTMLEPQDRDDIFQTTLKEGEVLVGGVFYFPPERSYRVLNALSGNSLAEYQLRRLKLPLRKGAPGWQPVSSTRGRPPKARSPRGRPPRRRNPVGRPPKIRPPVEEV